MKYTAFINSLITTLEESELCSTIYRVKGSPVDYADDMATCSTMGIKKGGINIRTCNVIYSSVVLPTLCFGCEIWLIKKKDINILQAFQRYAAGRIKRILGHLM